MFLRTSLAIFLCFYAHVEAQAIDFINVTEQAGFTVPQRIRPATSQEVPCQLLPESPCKIFQEEFSGGAGAGDFNGDGFVDIFMGRVDGPPLLYLNGGDGTFTDVAATAGPFHEVLPRGSNAGAWGDIDNDGDLDLYVTSWNTNRFHLFINNGDGSFLEEAVARGASLQDANPHFGQGITFGDYDRDGYLDISVAEWRLTHDGGQNPAELPSHNRLLRNKGAIAPGTFEDVTQGIGLSFEGFEINGNIFPTFLIGSLGFTPSFVDLDRDGWQDLAWVADGKSSRLFWNNRDGSFSDTTWASGVGTETNGMGSTFADFNGDGLLDWFITAIDFGVPCQPDDDKAECFGNRLYLNQGNRQFLDVTDEAGVRAGYWGWGASAFDFDNDGDQDIVHTTGMNSDGAIWQTDPMLLFENQGDATFLEIAQSVGLTERRQGRGLLTFDYDNDGDLDIFIVNHGSTPVLYRNDGGNAKNWLQVDVVGSNSNRDGIGAVVEILPEKTRSETRQIQHVLAASNFVGQDQKTLHFGLGDHTGNLYQVSITWPSGVLQTLRNIVPNQRLLVEESEGGVACAYQRDGQAACTGDCNCDAEVTVDELVLGTQIALGNLPADECFALDRNLDKQVTVEELVSATHRALNGCQIGEETLPTDLSIQANVRETTFGRNSLLQVSLEDEIPLNGLQLDLLSDQTSSVFCALSRAQEGKVLHMSEAEVALRGLKRTRVLVKPGMELGLPLSGEEVLQCALMPTPEILLSDTEGAVASSLAGGRLGISVSGVSGYRGPALPQKASLKLQGRTGYAKIQVRWDLSEEANKLSFEELVRGISYKLLDAHKRVIFESGRENQEGKQLGSRRWRYRARGALKEYINFSKRKDGLATLVVRRKNLSLPFDLGSSFVFYADLGDFAGRGGENSVQVDFSLEDCRVNRSSYFCKK